jgi:hypothetical protein
LKRFLGLQKVSAQPEASKFAIKRIRRGGPSPPGGRQSLKPFGIAAASQAWIATDEQSGLLERTESVSLCVPMEN